MDATADMIARPVRALVFDHTRAHRVYKTKFSATRFARIIFKNLARRAGCAGAARWWRPHQHFFLKKVVSINLVD
jgi:hypothetical protein